MEYANFAKVSQDDVTPHQEQGKFTEDDEYYRRAIALRERFLGLNAFITADCLYQLADTLAIQGHVIHAQSLYQRALTIYEQAMQSGNQCTPSQLERYIALKERLALSPLLLN